MKTYTALTVVTFTQPYSCAGVQAPVQTTVQAVKNKVIGRKSVCYACELSATVIKAVLAT